MEAELSSESLSICQIACRHILDDSTFEYGDDELDGASVGHPERKGPPEEPTRRWEDNIKMGL
jgi:hypothetical protein